MTKRERGYIMSRKAYRWAGKMWNRMPPMSEMPLLDMILPRPIHIADMQEENGEWSWKIKYAKTDLRGTAFSETSEEEIIKIRKGEILR